MPAYLHGRGGRIAFDITGHGPLVVCVPGMGDLRASYRTLAPTLVDAGYRVATMDLRGHGDSDATFDAYDDPALGDDILSLIDHLGRPALVVGNSMGAAGAVWAAAEDRAALAGLVLIGPFVREIDIPAYQRLLLRLALLRPWGRAAWLAYYKSLFPTRRPDDMAEHVAAISASLRRPHAWRAFKATMASGHAAVERRLGDVDTPVLVVMGTRDADFPDPAAEAETVAQALNAEMLLVPDAGHYPHVEFPDTVAAAVLSFFDRVASRA